MRLWFKVASHLKIPVDELRKRITYLEFICWLEYLSQEEEKQLRPTKLDHQLAHIQAEIRRSWVKDKKKVSHETFLLKLERSMPEDIKVKVEKSKGIWMSALNIKPGKN